MYVTHAFVSSRLNNMNSLLYKAPQALTKRLQNIQNNAARVVKKQRKSCHITPLLFDLHWLTVEYWSQYKILLLVYKSLHGKSPAHLASMLEKHSPIRFLCSAIQLRLYESWVKKRYGDRALSVVGPSLLNNLDPYIKQSSSVTVFKTRLKTYLFEKAFKASKI